MEEVGEKLARGPYRKRPTMSFGERGYEALELAFRLGGFTPAQHARFVGVDGRRSRRILAPLSQYKLTEQAPIPTPGRSALFHHLSKKDAGKAIVMAAQRAGVKEREAGDQYKLFQLPGRAEHHHERNEFYLSLLEATAADGGAEVPLSEMWGESYPEFPLRGEGRPRAQERENARMVYERIYPDGIFTLRWPGLEQRFLVEIERRTRSAKVISKLDGHAGRWLRLQGTGVPPLGFERFWPLLFLLPTRRRAVAMRDRVREAVLAKSVEVSRWVALVARLKEIGAAAPAGGFVLFASMEDVGTVGAAGGVPGSMWMPLVDYPPDWGGEQVALRTVAKAAGRLKDGGR